MTTDTLEKTFNPIPLLTTELKLPEKAIVMVVQLLAEGATVPFIARYRKEVTGGLDEVQIRLIEERHEYIQELEKRRQTILASIAEQGKLTDELRTKILTCHTKSTLEDLYLPYKQKRRTRATAAREKGLEPLALLLLTQALDGNLVTATAGYINEEKGVADGEAALAGARDILAEMMAENADIRAQLRETLSKDGVVISTAIPEKTKNPTKYEQYYTFREKLATIPSHRYLAIRRGEKEGYLKVEIELAGDPLKLYIQDKMGFNPQSPFAEQLDLAIQDGYQRLLFSSVQNELLGNLKAKSDLTAVDVFANNLRNLLLAPPMGGRPVIGIDPGLRTGCKCVALDATGKFLDKLTIFPEQGEKSSQDARTNLLEFIRTHQPEAIAVGNGTGGRETESFVRKLLAEESLSTVILVQVNEAGASIYSASELARQEFPDLDLTFRGAISIARRLQDPLAELVKIEPKSIGVGQYQHDVQQNLLQRKLGEVVESCVNHVGVDLNTASPELLKYVAGIGPTLAKKIVEHRQNSGPFPNRLTLSEVSGLGPKAFEQAAGFLRISASIHPLDASAVHPERYELVEAMAQDLGVTLQELVGNSDLADKIDIQRYISEEVGEPTLKDIVAELKKPGRDPRSEFTAPQFRDDVYTLEDLTIGMQLEGIVTNVAAFGVFVDIGVHHDGLVHISQLSDRFIKDPHQVVSVGERLKVRVLEVDKDRKRIQLSARSQTERPPRKPEHRRPPNAEKKPRPQGQSQSYEKKDTSRDIPRENKPKDMSKENRPKSKEVMAKKPKPQEVKAEQPLQNALDALAQKFSKKH